MIKYLTFEYDRELKCLVRVENGREVMRMTLDTNELLTLQFCLMKIIEKEKNHD